MEPQPVLVGDVGGTNTRFAVITAGGPPPWRITHRLQMTGEFPDLPAALRAYVDRAGLAEIPRNAVIAASGPVTTGRVRLTNRPLEITETELRRFGFERVLLINDFAALALAADVLGPDDLRPIGPALEGLAEAPIALLGAGTGLGVACLVRDRGRAIALTTEGGHIGFAPSGDQQMAVLSSLERRYGRVSVERILSGPGLEALHGVMEGFAGRDHQPLGREAITAAALAGDGCCRATLALFCSIYGAVAGDIALVHGARGGVLIGGGIAPKIERFLVESSFREAFEHKGRLSEFVKAIPTRLIINPDATLIGAARAQLDLDL